MTRSRSSGLLLLIVALMLGLLRDSPGRAADGDDVREREVYEALHQADLQADEEAREAYPRVEDEGGPDPEYIEARLTYRDDRKRLARDDVARRFGLSIDQVEAIRRRGDAEHWPLIDDPKPDPDREVGDRIAASVLAISLLVACCGIVYCALFRRSLLVGACTAAGVAWRRYVR